MKILFLSRWFPYPTDNGAKLRIYHLLRGLAEAGHEVHLASFADDPARADVAALREMCREVRVAAWKEFQPSSRKALLGLLSPEPRSLSDLYSPEMERAIRAALAETAFDLVIPSEWPMTAYRHLFAHLPVLYEEIEVGLPYGQWANAPTLAARIRSGLTWWKYRRYLRQVLGGGQISTVVSEAERSLLRRAVPKAGEIFVVPNGVDLSGYQAFSAEPEPDTLIFTGSFRYQPNYEAMEWFIEQVLPLIQVEQPEVRLTITGDSAGYALPKRAGVEQIGWVDDVRPCIASAWASVVPLHIGGGTRLKILEAMALRTPVISTTLGAEGIDAARDAHLLIGDTAGAFASQTIRLLKDPALRGSVASNAYQLVADRYDWRRILPKFLDVVEHAAKRSTGLTGHDHAK
jgi:glycosyltransferase involved in cell wall biosynthesis